MSIHTRCHVSEKVTDSQYTILLEKSEGITGWEHKKANF